MEETKRAKARAIAERHLAAGDPLGWFEDLYQQAHGEASVIPWADLAPNPNLIGWLDRHVKSGKGTRALKIGCGLGDDAEELSRRGFETIAFDISKTAISWCRKRFPQSAVNYVVMDLFNALPEWENSFDLVVESYTLQVLPPGLRENAIRAVSRFVRPAGNLLVIARAREDGEDVGKMPWPLLRSELDEFQRQGLHEVSFEDFRDREDPPVRRFRVLFERAYP